MSDQEQPAERPGLISRRALIGGAAGASIAGLAALSVTAASPARAATPAGALAPAAPASGDCLPGGRDAFFQPERSRTLTWFGDFTQQWYLTYPHANGFLEGGDYLTIAHLKPAEELVEVWAHAVDGSSATLLFSVSADPAAPLSRHRFIYWDVHLETGVLTFVHLDKVYKIDAAAALASGVPATPLLIYPGTGTNLPGLTSIHPDGAKVSFAHVTGPSVPGKPGEFYSKIVEVDLATSVATTLATTSFIADHAHYVPYDPDWVIWAHQGGSLTDEVWGHHATLAPSGMQVFDHSRPDGSVLHADHERASFTSDSYVIIQYSNLITDPVEPRGLWEGYLDGRPPRPIAGGVYLHADVSRDGVLAVCDAGLGGSFWVELVDMSGTYSPVVIATGVLQGAAHPRHLHPVLSPSGNEVYFIDSDPADPVAGGIRIGKVQL
jgi:hypothetical protein